MMKVEEAFETLLATGYVEAVNAIRDELEFTRKQRDLAQQALAVNERRRGPVPAREYAEAEFHVTDFARNCAVDLGGAGVIPQEVTATEGAKIDDFAIVTLTLSLADRHRNASL